MRLYIYAAIALAIVASIGGLLYKEHRAVKRAQAAEARITTLTTAIESERRNRAIENNDRKQADEAAKSLGAELAAIRSAPVKPVSVFCRPARVPSTTGEGDAATVADGAAIGGSAEIPLRDVGAAVEAVRVEQQSNAARQRALIQWEQSRTH